MNALGEQNFRARLLDLLRDNSCVTVHGVAERIGISEETAVAMLRRERVPMFVRAGSLWVRGRAAFQPEKNRRGAAAKGDR